MSKKQKTTWRHFWRNHIPPLDRSLMLSTCTICVSWQQDYILRFFSELK